MKWPVKKKKTPSDVCQWEIFFWDSNPNRHRVTPACMDRKVERGTVQTTPQHHQAVVSSFSIHKNTKTQYTYSHGFMWWQDTEHCWYLWIVLVYVCILSWVHWTSHVPWSKSFLQFMCDFDGFGNTLIHFLSGSLTRRLIPIHVWMENMWKGLTAS